jgi:hypothetical protein
LRFSTSTRSTCRQHAAAFDGWCIDGMGTLCCCCVLWLSTGR